MSAGTSTLPSAQTRPRSLRTRSTIMRFSARDFSSARSAAARYASSTGWAARGAVPLIGFDSTTPLAVDAQEALGRRAQHRDVAEAQQRRVRRGVARPQGPVGSERIDRAVAVQLGGQADLVASRPRRSRACRRRCWRGRRRGPRARRSAAARARRRRRGGRTAGDGLELALRWPPARLRRRARRSASASATRWTRRLSWSNAISRSQNSSAASGSGERCTSSPPQLGLELVAEVAGEAAGEVERQLGGVGAQAGQLALAVVEHALVQLLALVRRSTVSARVATS